MKRAPLELTNEEKKTLIIFVEDVKESHYIKYEDIFDNYFRNASVVENRIYEDEPYYYTFV